MFKRFFYACLGILCLTLAYHFGATNARGGQSPQPNTHPRAVGLAIANYGRYYVIDENGDVWVREAGYDAPSRIGNYWSAGTDFTRYTAR